MRLPLGRILIILIVLLGISQVIPVTRSNPPATSEIVVPVEVRTLLKRACYDCHSNETKWPWYSRIAPISWLIAHDVNDGRRHLNFSRWGELSTRQQGKKLKDIAKAIEEREMPPFYYLPVHPKARLSDQENTLLRDWARQGDQSSSN